MEPIVIATGNPHKVEEMREIFARFGLEVAGLRQLPGWEKFAEPQESGMTFEQNASIKARSYAEQTGRVCLADDSGLEVDALGGEPGVISSHYSSGGKEEAGVSRAARDEANNRLLMEKLRGVGKEARGARFVCVMALATPPGYRAPRSAYEARAYHEADPIAGLPTRLAEMEARPDAAHVLLMARGEFAGRIGVEPRVPSGKNGFGYDPLFLLRPDYQRTSAELNAEEKNRFSHRASAANMMVDLLVRSGIASLGAARA